MGATLLKGDPVVRDIEHWCLRKGRDDGIEPVLAVVFFNTDASAEHFVQIKAHVAARVNHQFGLYHDPPNRAITEPFTNQLTVYIGWRWLLGLRDVTGGVIVRGEGTDSPLEQEQKRTWHIDSASPPREFR